MDRPNDTPVSQERLQAFLDQVLLRIFNASPGLASYLESSRAVPEEGTIELSFYEIPEEVIAGVKAAVSVPEIEVLRYPKAGKACVGFRCKPERDDLSALAVDDGDREFDAKQASGDDGNAIASPEDEADAFVAED